MDRRTCELLFHISMLLLNIALGIFIVWDAGRERPEKKGNRHDKR
jgi:hypothetical protein